MTHFMQIVAAFENNWRQKNEKKEVRIKRLYLTPISLTVGKNKSNKGSWK